MEYIIWGFGSFVLAIATYVLGRQSVFTWYLDMEAKNTKEAEELKAEYEMKVAALEELVSKLEQEPEGKQYNPQELFAPGVSPEYGLPRKLG